MAPLSPGAVLLEGGGDRILMPSSIEFAMIEELVDILKPFNDATKILLVVNCILL